ncbi:MAG: hypothetical protein GY696_17545 [Gammaproteobacteria bacterium]|nr:hypothetical protein [Gammaproteobacteria bacterium]
MPHPQDCAYSELPQIPSPSPPPPNIEPEPVQKSHVPFNDGHGLMARDHSYFKPEAIANLQINHIHLYKINS